MSSQLIRSSSQLENLRDNRMITMIKIHEGVAFENENRLLRERLTEAGISYTDIVEDRFEDVASCYDPDQGACIRKFEVM